MGLAPSKDPPKIQKSSFRLTFFDIIRQNRGWKFTKSGLKWVAVARHGLILWENDATGFNIIFKCLPGPENQQTNKNVDINRKLPIDRFGG